MTPHIKKKSEIIYYTTQYFVYLFVKIFVFLSYDKLE